MPSQRSAKSNVRGVVDNNIWVSAILTGSGNPGRVLDAFLVGRFTIVTSEPLLAELADVLQRPRIARRSQFTPNTAVAEALAERGIRILTASQFLHELGEAPSQSGENNH